jgi:hypothetical protein
MVRGQSPQTVGTWAASGPVANGRAGAASAALDDGRTLIAGGTVAGTATASVVIYNPADNSFTSVGELTSARVGHSATLLEDGGVLIAGGAIAGAVSADLEVFNPADGTSALVGTMSSARAGHGAARLAEGTVLIVGGSDGTAALATAEVFDPDTSASTAVGSMAAARSGVSATRLIDNRVLVAGGYNGTTDLASAEIFNPFSQTFDAVPTTLSAARSGHSAILLPHNNSVLIAGGTSAGVAVVDSDLFLPAQFPDPYSYGMGQFGATGALTVARANAASGPAAEGFAFVVGGGSHDAERYRFATIKTDKDDYAPGEHAVITGSGWQSNEIVTLLFQEDPAVHADYVLQVQADINGSIYWDQWAPEDHDFGVRFYLMASGVSSRAQTTFTDGGFTIRASSGSTFTVSITTYLGTTNHCATTPPPPGTVGPNMFAVTSSSGPTVVMPNNSFAKFVVPVLSNENNTYSDPPTLAGNGGVIVSNVVNGAGTHRELCVRSTNNAAGQQTTLTINYVAPATATLNVIKHVVNDNGGTASANAWLLAVSSTDGGTGIGSAAGLESPGTTYTVQAGKTYNVNESGGPAGYAESKSADCTNLVPTGGNTYTCTITNDDIAPKLTVTKVVVNDHGGTKGVGDFPLFVDGSPVTSGVQGTFNAGTRTVSETGMTTYAATIGGDCAPDGTIALAPGDAKTCTITNDDIGPKLTVTKVVVNDNGGNKVVADFPLFVDGGSVVSGVQNTFSAGPHTVSETSLSTYASSFSGDCALDGTIALALGEVKSCTITNDDIAPKLTVTKVVVNDNGGEKVVADFPLFVDGNSVVSGAQNSFNAGPHTVTETSLASYAATFNGDCAPDGTITLALAEVKTCTITNDDIAPTLRVIKHVVNDNGGTATADNWTLSVTSSNGGAGTDSAPGAEAPGTPYTIEANKAYSVTESGGPPGYAASSSADCTIANAVLATNYTCTITNDDIAPTLTVIKNVVNDHGGTAVAAAWTLTVTSSNDGSGTGSAPGEGAPGTLYTIEANKAYAVSENGGPATGYAASLSADCTIANAVLATSYTCTITNDDIQPKLFVIKHVINDNGGTAVAGAFTMTVSGIDVAPSSFAGEESPGIEVGLDAGPYSVNETGLAGYARSDSADCSGSIAIGQTKTCTVTNDDIAPTVTVIKHVVNDHGGTASAGAWTLAVTSSNGGAGTGSGAGAEAPGTLYTIDANRSYAVNESGGPSGYAESKSADCTIANTVLATDYVCTITNDDIQPKLHVIKIVVNDNGGTAQAANFTLSVTGDDVSPQSFPGAGAPGTEVGLDAGTYSVDESGPSGYARSDSADCAGTIAIGQTKTCTITNDDIQPKLYVIKHVVNNNGGSAVASDFTMTVTGTNPSPASFSGAEAPGTLVGLDAGTYSVGESGPGLYARTDSGDCAGSIGIGQTKTCTVTNNDYYQFIGFFDPVENLPTLNGVNAGRAIPLKWELRSAAGALVRNLNTVTGITFSQIQCGSEYVEPVELPADDSGFSELRLTATGYHFNWKTEKSFANKCYEIRFTLDDDTVHKANFKFKK